MKIAASIITFIITLASLSPLGAQSLDEILARYTIASGHDKLMPITTIVCTGKAYQSGIEMPFTEIFKRPLKYMLDVDVNGQKMVQVFDGKLAWQISPWLASSDAADMNELETKILAARSDFDGLLVNIAAKHATAELAGAEDVDGRNCYMIKLIDFNSDQWMFDIDKNTFLLAKSTATMSYQDQSYVSTTTYGDYKDFGGIQLPTTIIMTVFDQTISCAYDNIEINKEVADSIFVRPPAR